MKEINTSKEVVLELIRNSSTFLIMTHRRPDGDVISSALAMYWYLLDVGKKEKSIDIVIPEYTKELGFIPGEDEKNLTNVNHKLIIQELQKEVEFDTLILLIENEAGEFKGSLRNFSDIDLNEVCSELLSEGKILKGGGHSYSAGCTAVGTLNEIFETISDAIIRKRQ